MGKKSNDIIQLNSEYFKFIYETETMQIINNICQYSQINPDTGNKDSWCEIDFTICYESFEYYISRYTEILNCCKNILDKINTKTLITESDLKSINKTYYLKQKQIILKPDDNISEMYMFITDFSKIIENEIQKNKILYEKCKKFRQWCYDRKLNKLMIRNKK
jgi:hypothetical protein